MSIFNTEELSSLKNEMISIRKDISSFKQQIDELKKLISHAVQTDSEEEVYPSDSSLQANIQAAETPSIEPLSNTEQEPSIDTEQLPQEQPDESQMQTVLLKRFDELKYLLENTLHQEKLIRDLHDELQKYKRGLIDDISKQYISDIINIYQRVSDTFVHFSISTDAEISNKQIKLEENTLLYITDLLENEYSVEAYDVEVGTRYLPKEHKAMRSIDTDNASQAGTVAEVLSKGFRNSETGRVIRPARVNVYKSM